MTACKHPWRAGSCASCPLRAKGKPAAKVAPPEPHRPDWLPPSMTVAEFRDACAATERKLAAKYAGRPRLEAKLAERDLERLKAELGL
jgi:hypothetical protein